MVSIRVCASLLVLGLATLAMVGCGPDARGEAEDRLAAKVEASVDGLLFALGNTSPGADLDPTQFEAVARHQVLLETSEVPTEAPARTLYCLEREGEVVTACVFYPVMISISAGIGVYKSTLYGCAELSGRADEQDVILHDSECPENLVEWLRGSLSYGDVEQVSISGVTGHRFDE